MTLAPGCEASMMYWKCSSSEVRSVSRRARRKADVGMELEIGWAVEVVEVSGLDFDMMKGTEDLRVNKGALSFNNSHHRGFTPGKDCDSTIPARSM